jgi:predicted Fe-Mo cluster-binding NifX family protein
MRLVIVLGERRVVRVRVCVPVTEDGAVGHGWGRADQVAVADVSDGRITDWQVIDVAWGESHDRDGEGAHHARVVRFLKEHRVEVVVVRHLGQGMRRTLDRMGLGVLAGVDGEARSAVLLVGR